MPIISFWNGTNEQCGTTSASVAFATQLAIEHNIKILLISTSFNDSLINDCFWKKEKKSIFFAKARHGVETAGIEGLNRLIRSNRMTPNSITDYTKVVLTNRLEIISGIEGNSEQLDLVKEQYVQIVEQAGRYYDMVIVDLDNVIGEYSVIEVLKKSDIVIAMVSQRSNKIIQIRDLINNKDYLKEEKTLITIGNYMKASKYNSKNITRNILKKKNIINTIPYNNLFFEASQEGKIIDLFLKIMNLDERKEDYFLVAEIKRLYENINTKLRMSKMMR